MVDFCGFSEMMLYDVVLIALNCKNDLGTTEIRSSRSSCRSCCICQSVLRPFILLELQPGGERNWRFWIPSAAGSVRAELTIPVESTLDTRCHWMSLDVTPSVSLSDSFQVLLDGGYLDGMGKTPVALRSMVLPACPLDLCGS